MKVSLLSVFLGIISLANGEESLNWKAIPEIPSELGVAGPFVGVHNDVLLVGGGANFPEPVWENDKVWHRQVYALPLTGSREWKLIGELPRAIGYGASVSVNEGVICIGGNDAETVFDDVFLLKSDGNIQALPSLPKPSCNGAAATIGPDVYFFPAMCTSQLESASQEFWRLNLDNLEAGWEALTPLPAAGRAFCVLVAQHKEDGERIYLLGGRLEKPSGEIAFLSDVFEFDPEASSIPWKKMASMSNPLAAGTGVAVGAHHIFMLSGADGSLMAVADELKLDHPGFPKTIHGYNTVTNTWSEAGEMPANQVTTSAVAWKDKTYLVTGEIKPRVRTRLGWEISLSPAGLLKPD